MSEKKPRAILPSHPGKVRCLRCNQSFMSPDKRRVRLCRKCRGRET